jgi:hypothetical protein
MWQLGLNISKICSKNWPQAFESIEGKGVYEFTYFVVQ